MVILKFYRNGSLVRTEICHNEFEADIIAEKEKQKYTEIKLEYEKKEDDVI